jgi:hypothetical protein
MNLYNKIYVPAEALTSPKEFRKFINLIKENSEKILEIIKTETSEDKESWGRRQLGLPQGKHYWLHVYDEALLTNEAFLVFLKERYSEAPFLINSIKSSWIHEFFGPVDEWDEFLDRIKKFEHDEAFPSINEIDSSVYDEMLSVMLSSNIILVPDGISVSEELHKMFLHQAARGLLGDMLVKSGVRVRRHV